MSKTENQIPNDKLALYDKLIETHPNIETERSYHALQVFERSHVFHSF